MTHRTELLQIPAESPRFEGHFPGQPLLPGVALLLDWVIPRLEAATQREVTGARRVKFLAPVRPGEALSLSFDWKPDSVSFRVQREGKPVARGELLLSP